ncbi:MAG TPA: lyase, partial [Thermoanaerobaculia bacterium]|nr:lyase [Thermoanaerobaculia bacterium]
MKAFHHLLLLLAVALLPSAVDAANPVISEWPVPWEDTRPRDPAVDANGNVWFVGQRGDYIASLDPKTGKFNRFELEKGTGPHNLIVDNRGVWFAGNRKGYIGLLNPATRSIRKFPMPDSEAKDPHTLTFDAEGDIWFTLQASNMVGKLETATGKVYLARLTTPGSRPYGIVIDSKGKPWFNEFGTNKIGTIDPATMKVREYTLPNSGARGRRIEVGTDGTVWYVDYARGTLARLDPASGAVREWETPSGSGSLPYAMARGASGTMWLVETGPQPNRLIGFDPRTSKFVASAEVPSGGSTVRHMIYHAPS